MPLDRRRFMAYCSSVGLSTTLFPGVLYAQAETEPGPITVEMIEAAARIAGLSFSNEHREMMVEDLNSRLDVYERLRGAEIPNDVFPALIFDPTIAGASPDPDSGPVEWALPDIQRPRDDDAIAFMSILEQASLLRSRQLTSVELTRIYLDRIRALDGKLFAVVTTTEERALEQARVADAEMGLGQWRGPLHGIPYGAKDLLAVRGYPTTWGAVPYRDQVIEYDATVIRKLDEAGAVLIAKLTLGALAWGDVWFGGMTRNPWNLDEGSSGSSAGPGAAVAAGLVSFAIGSETLGSIVSPSTRNGVTGHRPTFGLVSRDGAMALSWSMDKLGPMARSALDCAIVFDTIRGQDSADPSTREAAFRFDPSRPIADWRVGYLATAFDDDYPGHSSDAATLGVLCDLGVDLIPIDLPEMPVDAMLLTLEVEAAAAFDELTRTGESDRMVRQTKDAWPHVFRMGRMVPAVEYVQANRARTLLMRAMADVMADIDVFVSPSFRGGTLSITNLTGHPAVAVPNHFSGVEGDPMRRSPRSISFVGSLYGDAAALELAHAYQCATDYHLQRPPMR
jgi:Asp-tRNA(Asn)/Glu-tRNA(Gln) amidotransferase A subunit family amidase